mmetsp:Transcript_2689/g.5875  ORF Transcript_2689/g.5875 Transcript_2689/m.5875 type:complete len:275 (-) Transcript_2689:820-1644(-)
MLNYCMEHPQSTHSQCTIIDHPPPSPLALFLHLFLTQNDFVLIYLAMLMINKNQANRNSPNDTHDQRPNPIHRTLAHALDPRNGIARGNIKVHPSRHGKNDPRGLIRRIHRQEHHPAQHHRQPRKEVEHARLCDGKSRVPRQYDEVGELLRQLVEERDEDDGDGGPGRAGLEGGADEDAVAEVVEAVAEEDGGAEFLVDEGFGWEGACGLGRRVVCLAVIAFGFHLLHGHRHAGLGIDGLLVLLAVRLGGGIARILLHGSWVIVMEEDGEDERQ